MPHATMIVIAAAAKDLHSNIFNFTPRTLRAEPDVVVSMSQPCHGGNRHGPT